jgi:serine/threonine-protein kinase
MHEMESLEDVASSDEHPSLDVEGVDEHDLLDGDAASNRAEIDSGRERLRESQRAPSRREPLASRARDTVTARSGGFREGAIIGGRYRIDRITARTESALVFAATHLELGHAVTFRCLLPDAAGRPGAVARFLAEARTLSQVKSEHAARVLDVGKFSSGVPFVVLEAVPGWDLDEVLRVRGPLPVQEAVEYVIQASESAAEVHSRGLVYGSLNPRQLVLVRQPDGSPFIKVIGLGLGEPLDLAPLLERASFMEEGSLTSRLPYLAPEQIRAADDVDARADVWALGAVLYTLLAGAPPFHGRTAVAILAAVSADAPQPVAELRGDISPELDAVVLRCLSKERGERFASIAELLMALRPFASGEALQAVDRVSRMLGLGSKPPPLPSSRPSALVPVARTTPPRSQVGRAPAAAAAPSTASVPARASERSTFIMAALGTMAGGAVMLAAGLAWHPTLLQPGSPPSDRVAAAPAVAEPVAPKPEPAASVPVTKDIPAAALQPHPPLAARPQPRASSNATPTSGARAAVAGTSTPASAASAQAPAGSSPPSSAPPATRSATTAVATSSKDLFDDTR